MLKHLAKEEGNLVIWMVWARMIPSFLAGMKKISLIMSWLLSSMQPEISKNLHVSPYWPVIYGRLFVQSYSKIQDAEVIYELKIKISTTKQGTISVTRCYDVMRGIWLEMDHYQNVQMKC